MQEDLLSLASDIVDKTRALGSDETDVYVVSGIESTVSVRLGQLDKLIDAGSRRVTIRVIKDKRTAICSTSDLTPKALSEMAAAALELAKISEPDEYAGLPEAEDLALDMGVALQLYDERIESLSIEEMKDIVLRAEQAAFDFDTRITNSEEALFQAERGQIVLANSLGFAGSYPHTAASYVVQVMADDADGKKRNDYWYSAERFFHRLAPPEEVGRRAASRAVAKLGARKAQTREVPVVWDPTMTAALAGILATVSSGEMLYRRSTFLADLEGHVLASPLVTLTDDATLPGRLGSRPFDGEGVRTRTNPILESGTFSGFLFDSYSARRTRHRTTGSASRPGDAIEVGHANLVWQAGNSDPNGIISGVDDGLYLTDLMGFGVNHTTGDFSRGAAGMWIERGEITYPVTEINVSGNLKDMLRNVEAVGNDQTWLAGTAAPTIKMAHLMVSGL